jgi:hypothetical protein
MPMHSELEHLPPATRKYLRAFVWKKRIVQCVRGLGMSAALFSIWALVCCLADRSLLLPPLIRWVALWIGIAGAATIGVREVWLCFVSMDWLAVASQIEHATPEFSERLQTVISEQFANSRRASSRAMLQQLINEVESLAAKHSGARLVRWNEVFGPWLAGLAAWIIFLATWGVPALGMPRLLARMIHPGRPIDPVTFTKLEISPKDTEVLPDGSVTISAVAAGSQLAAINARGLDLFLSADGRAWSRAVMNPVSLNETESHFAFSVPTIDRNLRYYVRGGDARSDEYRISVKHIPSVSAFRIRYTYPPYTGRSASVITNTDGLIEALVGCQANITVKSTEPLLSATLMIDGQRIELARGSSESEWQGQFTIWANTTFSLDMVSTSGVLGHGPTPMLVRALPDREPVTQIQQPTGDLRLMATERVNLHFSAADDYGLKSVEIMARLNDEFPQIFNVPILPRSLRREGEFTFDLAELKPSIGDQISFRLRAEDFGGHLKTGEPRQFLIGPISVASKTYARAAELKRVAKLLGGWNEQWIKAKEAVDATRSGDPRNVKQDVWLRANRSVSAAVDTVSVRQALLRVLVRSDSNLMGWFIQGVVDETMTPPIEPGRVLSAATRADDALVARVGARISRSKELGDVINVVVRGEQASLAINELENLRVISAVPVGGAAVREIRGRAIERMRRTIEMILHELSLAPNANHLNAQLRQFVDKENGILRNARAIDVAAVMAEWADRMKRTNVSGIVLSSRLQAMSLVEAIRPGGDLVFARDLQLISRAVSSVGAAVAQARDSDRGRSRSPARDKLFEPMARLIQHTTTLLRDPANAPTSRLEIAKSAGDPAPSDTVEPLAFEANAASIELQDQPNPFDEKFEAEIARISQDEASVLNGDLAQLRQQYQATREVIRDQGMFQDAVAKHDVAYALPLMKKTAEAIGALDHTVRSSASTRATNTAAIQLELPGHHPLMAANIHRPLRVAQWNADRAMEQLNSVSHSGAWNAGALNTYSKETVAALQLEEGRLIQEGARRRLEEVPSLSSLFAPYAPDEGVVANLAGGWPRYGTKFHEVLRAGADLDGHREADPAGYQEQLKSYFDAVNRAQQGKRP